MSKKAPDKDVQKKEVIKERLKEIEMAMSSEEIILRLLLAFALFGYAIYSLYTGDFYFPATKRSSGQHYHGNSAICWSINFILMAMASSYAVFRHWCWRKKIFQKWVNFKIEKIFIAFAFVFLLVTIVVFR